MRCSIRPSVDQKPLFTNCQTVNQALNNNKKLGKEALVLFACFWIHLPGGHLETTKQIWKTSDFIHLGKLTPLQVQRRNETGLCVFYFFNATDKNSTLDTWVLFYKTSDTQEHTTQNTDYRRSLQNVTHRNASPFPSLCCYRLLVRSRPLSPKAITQKQY